MATYRVRMSVLALASFVGALLEALFLVIVTGLGMALVTDTSSVGPYLGQSMPMGTALGVGALVLLVRVVLNLWTVSISARLTAIVTTDQRLVASHAYLGTSWAVQQTEPAGRLQELVTTFVNRVTSAVTLLTQAVTALLSLVAFMGASLLVDPISTLAVIAVLALVGTILYPLRQRIRRHARLAASSNLAFSNAIAELGSLGLQMQTFGVRSRFAARIDALTREATEQQRRVQVLTGSLAPVYVSVAYAALLGAVGVLHFVGFRDLTSVGAIMLLMLRSLNYGQQLASAWGSLVGYAPFLDRLEAAVKLYKESAANDGDVVPSAVTPLEIRDATFSYDGNQPALSCLNFRIHGGEIIGVVGPSGAGKSTLAQLVLGLRDPDKGALFAGGADLRQVDRTWWTKRTALVAQDALLLTGSVSENLRFFRDDISDEALRQAAREANILHDIEAMPHGFDTHLGERGTQLSGGQRQRLSIARALVGDPEMLVLDEPTSALDGLSESLIRDALNRLKGRVTVLVIAHRMSTLDICDRIMVIEDGRISAIGTPAELERDSAFYRRALSLAGISNT